MSRKTRKLMWSVPLIAAVAVIGALAAFGALGFGNVFANELADNPQNLKVTPASGNAGRTTLELTWQAPASGAPDMYRIDVSTNNQKYTFLTEVSGTTLTYSHVVRPKGMDRKDEEGWERFYRVYAKNSHGYGAVSTAESKVTNDLAVPGEVGRVTGSSNGPVMNTLNWSTPDDGGSDILGYCIFAVNTVQDTNAATGAGVTDDNCRKQFLLNGPGKSDASLTTATTNTGDVIRILPATTYAHTKLRAEEEWVYEVYAFNRYGHSETSSGERTIETDEANDPSEPGDLFALQDVTTTGGAEVNLYWTAPDDGGQNISSYRVEVSDTNNVWPLATLLTTASNFEEITAIDDKTTSVGSFAASTDPDTADAMVAVITLAVATQTEAEPYQLKHTLPDTFVDGDTLYYRVRTITGMDASTKMSADTDPESITIVDEDEVNEAGDPSRRRWDTVQSGHCWQ